MKYIVAILIITTQLLAVVSISPVEIGDNSGFSGGVELGLDTKRGNTHKDAYKASANINYDNNTSYVTWFRISGEYGKANDVEDTNKIYAHLRYIHSLSEDLLRYEVFLQAQEDKFKALNYRGVGGIGLRAKIFNTPIGGKGYFGLGAMYEEINYTDPSIDPDENNIRLNSYLAYSLKFTNNSSLVYTFYYQPVLDDFEDYVMTNDLELILEVYKKLYLKFSLSYDRDSRPPNGIEDKYDLSQSTTFLYEF
jgi:putative salt-induced outer membrane protein YdiY